MRDPVQHFVDGGNHGQDREEIFVISIGYLEIRPCVPLVGGIHPASGPGSDRLGLHGFDGVSYLLRVRFLRRETNLYLDRLGRKGEKLRFYVLMTSKGKKPFQEYQRQTIEREFAYYLPKTDCEIERLTIGEQYVELVFLIPVRTDIKATLDRVINECNQYGDFLSNVFTITNVKELTAEEVSEIINKNGDD